MMAWPPSSTSHTEHMEIISARFVAVERRCRNVEHETAAAAVAVVSFWAGIR